MALAAQTRNNLFILPKNLAYAIQFETNNQVAATGQRYAYTDQVMKVIYQAASADPEAFDLGDYNELTIWEFAETHLPQVLYPAPILLVDN